MLLRLTAVSSGYFADAPTYASISFPVSFLNFEKVQKGPSEREVFSVLSQKTLDSLEITTLSVATFLVALQSGRLR